MNYTGGPSISGCRPVLSLYPTHRFCQYLLLIFITFTNSSLFNRAFSTNSRKRLGNNLSVKGSPFGGAGEEQGDETERARLLTENHRHRDSIALIKSLPIAAPAALSRRACPLRHCFAMPPLPKGEALAGRKAQKNPLSEIGAPGGGLSFWVSQWTHLLLPLSLLLYAILPKSQALHRKFTVTLLLAGPVSFWRIICYNGFAALPAHLFGRGGEKNGKYSFFYTVCRSKCSSLLYLQVA